MKTLRELGFTGGDSFRDAEFESAVLCNLKPEYHHNDEALISLAYKLFPLIRRA